MFRDVQIKEAMPHTTHVDMEHGKPSCIDTCRDLVCSGLVHKLFTLRHHSLALAMWT